MEITATPTKLVQQQPESSDNTVALQLQIEELEKRLGNMQKKLMTTNSSVNVIKKTESKEDQGMALGYFLTMLIFFGFTWLLMLCVCCYVRHMKRVERTNAAAARSSVDLEANKGPFSGGQPPLGRRSTLDNLVQSPAQSLEAPPSAAMVMQSPVNNQYLQDKQNGAD